MPAVGLHRVNAGIERSVLHMFLCGYANSVRPHQGVQRLTATEVDLDAQLYAKRVMVPTEVDLDAALAIPSCFQAERSMCDVAEFTRMFDDGDSFNLRDLTDDIPPVRPSGPSELMQDGPWIEGYDGGSHHDKFLPRSAAQFHRGLGPTEVDLDTSAIAVGFDGQSPRKIMKLLDDDAWEYIMDQVRDDTNFFVDRSQTGGRNDHLDWMDSLDNKDALEALKAYFDEIDEDDEYEVTACKAVVGEALEPSLFDEIDEDDEYELAVCKAAAIELPENPEFDFVPFDRINSNSLPPIAFAPSCGQSSLASEPTSLFAQPPKFLWLGGAPIEHERKRDQVDVDSGVPATTIEDHLFHDEAKLGKIGEATNLVKPVSAAVAEAFDYYPNAGQLVRDSAKDESSLAVGQQVQRRNVSQPWGRGYITSLDPLLVTYLDNPLNNPLAAGLKWDEVRVLPSDKCSQVTAAVSQALDMSPQTNIAESLQEQMRLSRESSNACNASKDTHDRKVDELEKGSELDQVPTNLEDACTIDEGPRLGSLSKAVDGHLTSVLELERERVSDLAAFIDGSEKKAAITSNQLCEEGAQHDNRDTPLQSSFASGAACSSFHMAEAAEVSDNTHNGKALVHSSDICQRSALVEALLQDDLEESLADLASEQMLPLPDPESESEHSEFTAEHSPGQLPRSVAAEDISRHRRGRECDDYENNSNRSTVKASQGQYGEGPLPRAELDDVFSNMRL